MENFISANKVKLIGAAITLIGFIQGYPGITSLLTATQYPWFMFVLGVLATWFGALKTSTSTNFVNNYKTVFVGALTSVISFIQGYQGLNAMLSAHSYTVVAFLLGIGLVICGIINTFQNPSPQTK